MSTILHLSDLHLGDADAWERSTDDKAGIIPPEESSRLAVLRTSLQAIKRLVSAGEHKLDAIVVSGDLTSGYEEVGFRRFVEVLDEVDLVAREAVLVVPGNHDVDWKADPSTPGKYARFLEHTRELGMRTPFCDGADIASEDSDPPPQPILQLDDALVVAINSSNWCGTRLNGSGSGSETVDIARVSESQLDRLTDGLRGIDAGARVRIAVTHHHLLPVTEDEEAKPFESFTNLARLRAWLRAHGFHVVLHGHKHAPALTWDHVYEFDQHDRPARQILVVSAPTPTTWGEPVCRLLRLGAASARNAVPGAPRIVVETVDAERAEHPLEPTRVAVGLDPGSPAVPGLIAIDTATADAAYERLVDELDARPGKLHNVICVVRDAASAEAPPTNFRIPPVPDQREVDDPQAWLEDAVTWWQLRNPALVASGAAPFNHGERLHGGRVGKPGALEIAASQLGSTKAMALIVGESELRQERKAPAFVAVQLVRANDEAGERLDCVGYFRKQDLTLWWPVNIAELRAIQQYVLDLDSVEGLVPGRLVTIAVEAVHDYVMPQLAGTLVDRAVDLRPEVLMRMAYQAAHGPETEREAINRLWTEQLGDIGSSARDFPSLGISRLIEHLEVFVEQGRGNAEPLVQRLQAVYDRAYRAKMECSTGSERETYSEALFALVGEVLEAVDKTIPTDSDAGAAPSA